MVTPAILAISAVVAPDAVALRTPVRARFATDADRPPLVEVEGPEHVPLG